MSDLAARDLEIRLANDAAEAAMQARRAMRVILFYEPEKELVEPANTAKALIWTNGNN